MRILTDQEISDFIAKQRAFVRDEHESMLRDVIGRWSRPLKERVQRGDAIANLKVEEIRNEPGGQGVRILLSCLENDSRYREGDFVRLTHDAPSDTSACLARGRIALAEDERVEVVARRAHANRGQIELALDVDYLDLTQFYGLALDTVASTEHGRNRIIPLLLGRIEPAGATPEEIEQTNQLVLSGFNEQQALGIVQAEATNLCHLIQGPPGTGKTQVLARLVTRLLKRKPNASILVTSFTHRAIDNALIRVHRNNPAPGRLFKIAASAPTEALPHALNITDLPRLLDGGPMILGATPFALQHRLRDIEFDWIIVDEASQMTLPLAIMAMNAGRRWILFGDHKQLPPVVQSVPIAKAVSMSVFGRLRNFGYCTSLTQTYRLPPALAEWPQKQFYPDGFESAGSARHHRLQLPKVPVGFESILNDDTKPIFISLDHVSCTSVSDKEAEFVGTLLKALHSVGFDFSEIGIVVPFRRQARRLRQELSRCRLPSQVSRLLVADTVERMQGQERDIVIVSLTTSDAVYAAALADFLCQPERLNVSITRPRKKLIVVGSQLWLTKLPKQVPGSELLVDFLAQCEVVRVP